MYNINLFDWLILKTIAEEKKITKAAERLFISQPALTRRLKNLETQFKATLLIRTPNGIVFTPQGEELLAYAEKALLENKQLCEKIQSMETKVKGTLFLGVSSVFAHYELPQLLKDFLEIFPEVEFSLKTGHSTKIFSLLQKDEISLGLLRGDYHWDEEKLLLNEEPICLVSSKPIELKDLPQNPRIMTNSSVQNLAEEWWHQLFNTPPKSLTEVDSIDTCRQMVLHGLGWAILPAIGLKQYNKSLYIKKLYFKDGTPLVRRTWLMYRNSYLQLPAICAFIEHIKQQFYQRE